MGITKNRQSEETVQKMIEKAFPNQEVQEIKELSDGYCNVTYRIVFADGRVVILKVAPESAKGTLRNEKNMMTVEIESMKYMQDYPEVPVAKVLFADDSRTICSGEYFFMENMEGENFGNLAEKMEPEKKASIYYEIGQVQRKLSEIRGEKFGILGQTQYDTLFEFVYTLFQNLMEDMAEVKDCVSLMFTGEELLHKLEEDSHYFHEVQIPSILHWDMWDGNVFIKDNHVVGLIDWERTMWAEPLMSDRFRSHSCTEELLKGFGQTEFSLAEKKRMAWYDVFLFTTMTVEEVFRQYEDDGQSKWVRPFLEAAWTEILEDEIA